MKKYIIIFLIIISCSFAKTQHIHKENDLSLSIGHGGIVFPNLNFQIEQQISSKNSLGSNIRYYYTIQKGIKLTGPMFQVFNRYYLNKQLKHGNNFFLELEALYGKTPLPSNSDPNDVLYDVNNTLVLDEDGNMIRIYNDKKLYRYGLGFSMGYKRISCKDWFFEISLGYNYWQTPQYYSAGYMTWMEDNCCNFTFYKESRWQNGFPIDLQLRIGKVIP